MDRPRNLGLASLVALVVANMLGAGVFTTSGFALADLGSPGYVLGAWFVGGLFALCGAISYGYLAKIMPVSGGEYYFLSRGVHPLVGFIAGWISLWAGFTGAIAFAAITFEAYLLPRSLAGLVPEHIVASLIIVLAALAHGLRLREGVLLQNASVALKLCFILGIVLFVAGSGNIDEWPGVRAWSVRPTPDFSASAFAVTLIWVSYSYSGYNAAIYVASEARTAPRTVPQSMLLATLLVTALYLVLNAIFLFAPAPEAIAGRQDVAAIAVDALAGDTLAGAMRALIALALLTSISAMVMAGPRVYAQMAEDGLMPRLLRFGAQVPGRAIAAQAVLAVAVVWLTGLRELLSYLGVTLGLSAAITVASLFTSARRAGIDTRELTGYPWVPIVFIISTLSLVGLAAIRNPVEVLAAFLTIISAILVYLLFGRKHQRFSPDSRSPG